MNLLTEEVRLENQKDLCSFDLTKVKTLCGNFFRCCHHGIGIGAHEVSEVLSCADNFIEYVFLLGLERQIWYLGLPILQVFELWTCCIAWDFDTPIADWTGILVVLFDLTACDLEAFSVVPINVSKFSKFSTYDRFCHTTRDTTRIQSSCQLLIVGTCRKHPFLT